MPKVSRIAPKAYRPPAPVAYRDKGRYAQPHYPGWLRQQWAHYVQTNLEKNQLRIVDLAELTDIDNTYIWMFRGGWIPDRWKVAAVGRAFGDLDGALRAAGMWLVPEEPITGFGLSCASIELLQLLDQVEHEEQDRLVTGALNQLRARLECRKTERQVEAC